MDENINVFFMPSYANAKLKASYNGHSESDDDWEFGVGAGLGYAFNEKQKLLSLMSNLMIQTCFRLAFQ